MQGKDDVKLYFKRLQESRMKCDAREKSESSDPAGLVGGTTREESELLRSVRLPSGTNLSPVDASQHEGFLPPVLKEHDSKVCLVVDLDETLVHSSFKPVAMPSLIMPVNIDGQTYHIYVRKRPFVDEFLRKVGKFFEPVIFTASLAKYASPLVDKLDAAGVFPPSHRLYRDHCSQTNGAYVKDLSLLGRPLEQICIIDNSPVAYLFQPRNALPCSSWFEDPDDTELRDMIPFLERLAGCSSVYEILDEHRAKLGLD
eukprot:Hpha_TRINITY_DN13876_c0_g1::TRINITY_DN13876_c0_g1_i1::g.69636::m.69636/K15731/CTDSP; carboxy-terminal domain RNA polymerase II polypeptide A small phosphatase